MNRSTSHEPPRTRLARVAHDIARDWPRFLQRRFDEDRAAGLSILWARPAWFAAHVPPPLVNAAGEELLRGAFVEHLATGSDYGFMRKCLEAAAALAGAGYRSVFEPGELNVGETHCSERRRPLDLEIQAFVDRLFAQDRYWRVELKQYEMDLLIDQLAEGSHTPPPRVLPHLWDESRRPATVRHPEWLLADDMPYWRARYWRPQDYGFGHEPEELAAEPPWYRRLMAAMAPEWTLDTSRSPRTFDVYTRPLCRGWDWALIVPSPVSADRPSLRISRSGTKKVSLERDTLELPMGPVKDNELGCYNPRGLEAYVRIVVRRHHAALIDYLGPAFCSALDGT